MGKRTLRQVTDDTWLIVEEISDITIIRDREETQADCLRISMTNGNDHLVPCHDNGTAEDMIINLMTGQHL